MIERDRHRTSERKREREREMDPICNCYVYMFRLPRRLARAPTCTVSNARRLGKFCPVIPPLSADMPPYTPHPISFAVSLIQKQVFRSMSSRGEHAQVLFKGSAGRWIVNRAVRSDFIKKGMGRFILEMIETYIRRDTRPANIARTVSSVAMLLSAIVCI